MTTYITVGQLLEVLEPVVKQLRGGVVSVDDSEERWRLFGRPVFRVTGMIDRAGCESRGFDSGRYGLPETLVDASLAACRIYTDVGLVMRRATPEHDAMEESERAARWAAMEREAAEPIFPAEAAQC